MSTCGRTSTSRRSCAPCASAAPRSHPWSPASTRTWLRSCRAWWTASPSASASGRIAELNAYQPPEPEEWLPADAALPSDVADPKAALSTTRCSRSTSWRCCTRKVPSVFKETPESLTDVDYQFWLEDFPEVFERDNIDEHAVPAVGAYLGEVLVRHLGGQWMPRKKLEEAQVRVGNRVWLPFLRAHRYMRSRQSLLDYSLTQLYRVAAHHRLT